MSLEGCEGTSLPGGPVVKNPPADEAGDRVFSIDPKRREFGPWHWVIWGFLDISVKNPPAMRET